MSRPALYRRSPSALTRTVGDVVLIAIPERKGFEKLKATSSVAWHLLEQPQTATQLVDDLAHLYGAPTKEVATSIECLLEAFVGRGLIEVIHDG